MKKFSLLMIICLVFTMFPVAALAEDTSETAAAAYTNAEELYTAVTLLDALAGESSFKSETVTRGEFVSFIAQLMKLEGSADAAVNTIFSDVPAGHPYAKEIYIALQLGWISSDNTFRPDETMLVEEALKTVVNALGYEAPAMSQGGYPTGYLRIARQNKLLKGITVQQGELHPDQAKVLAYHMLQADALVPSYSYSEDIKSTSYQSSGISLLESLYDVKQFEGIINATTYNAFEYGTPVIDDRYIEINGENFRYDAVTPELLGLHVIAFYREQSSAREIMALDTHSVNKSIQYELRDLIYTGTGSLEAEQENGKVKKLRLSNLVMIYNGRTVETPDASYFDGDGFAVLIDNDEDGSYEVIQVTSYRYVVSDDFDRYNRMIGDVNAFENSLNFSDISDQRVCFFDGAGNKISPYDIENNAVLQVTMPEDQSFAFINVLSNTVFGTVDAIGKDTVVINGTEYKFSKYFESYYLKKLKVGLPGSFYLGYQNALVSQKSSVQDFYYGFVLMADDKASAFGDVRVKMFTQAGKHEILDVADKFYYDGVKANPDVMMSFNDDSLEDARRLVRYSLNNDGELYKIDTAVDYNYESHESQTADNDNKLVYYPNYSGNIRYRGVNSIFVGDFCVASAVCFRIPTDITSEEMYFKAGTASSMLTHDATYGTVYTYDMNDEGSAGAIIIKSTANALTSTDGSYLVEEVGRGVDGEGMVLNYIKCWRNNQYYTYYLRDDAVIFKDSASAIEPGDLVRIKLDNDKRIYLAQVDFDYGNFSKYSGLNSSNYMNASANPGFWMGIPYSVSSGGIAQLATTLDEYGEYDFSQYNLSVVSVNTTYVAKFDCATETIRPITYSEIKTYKEFRDDCDYLILRSNFDLPNLVIVYENIDDR